jgi:hypothetical protein
LLLKFSPRLAPVTKAVNPFKEIIIKYKRGIRCDTIKQNWIPHKRLNFKKKDYWLILEDSLDWVGKWNTTTLSQARYHLAASSIGEIVDLEEVGIVQHDENFGWPRKTPR